MTVTINGNVSGDIEAGDRVEITATGCMRGDIRSSRVILHDGAKFKGRIDMEPDGIEEVTGTQRQRHRGRRPRARRPVISPLRCLARNRMPVSAVRDRQQRCSDQPRSPMLDSGPSRRVFP